ncbi:MAG: excinuclease ABC subunit UvrA [Clostridia bacterium]|nr:excinuclease ABC subunit UvrA [Clostridia bacterium]
MRNDIFIKNAKVNNLKGVDVSIPRDKLVVFTGISGSGKSSLAFDTLFAEGQRRYVESLSAYARQFLGQMEKPDVEYIEGLSPAISIDQKTTSSNPRSTVGTVTEIYDYLRLLFARVGTPYCPKCGREIRKQSVDEICDQVMAKPQGTKIMIMAPVIRARKGEYQKLFADLRKNGYARVNVDGINYLLEEEIKLDKNIKHNISVVVDRLVIKQDMHKRLADSIETALRLANNLVVVDFDGEQTLFSASYACPDCGISIEEFEPRMFSFNSPFGACPECKGLGFVMEFDEDLIIPDKTKSLADGAIKIFGVSIDGGVLFKELSAFAKHYGFSLYTPVEQLSKQAYDIIMYGNGGEEIEVEYSTKSFSGKLKSSWEGIMPMMTRRYAQTSADWVKAEYEKFMRTTPCDVCHGKRLKNESLSVKIGGKNIAELCDMSITDLCDFFANLSLDSMKNKIAEVLLKEINARLNFLVSVGLDYLTLSRSSGSLSGGEAQRIRLATQIGSGLMGVLYILDEPSIGLHQRDNEKLIGTLKHLRDLGNTLIVVEHDEDTILSADHVIDIGPGAGVHGGELVYAGDVDGLKNCEKSVTGQYLSHKKYVPTPQTRREPDGRFLSLKGASVNNLKNVNVDIPVGLFNVVTGVSGSGKSSLINETLLPVLTEKLNRGRKQHAQFKEICGLEHFDKVIAIDQSPIGRTPRSNPATYTGMFTAIRELFAQTPDAKERGYKAGRFSFNVRGGRCDHCDGDGIIKIEMNFLPDVYVPCEVCDSQRYNKETLQVKYKGKNISDVLNMTVEEALGFFENISAIRNKLQTLYDVGLGYITLGQSATTLSGGEAQRVKLATELAKRSTGKTIYILDEPTTGLHAADVDKLISILQRLVAGGNTVIVIEHNLDVIRVADNVIDLGPEGGDKGGTILATGTPEQIAQCQQSHTGRFLKMALQNYDKQG